MKKRIVSILLLCSIFFSAIALVSCSCNGGTKYEPVKSTKEEKETVIKLDYDGEKYKIPYELYRAFFLQLKPAVDGGNEQVWSGPDKDEYIKQIDSLIYDRIAEIYTVFYLADKAKIKPFSNKFDKEITKVVEVAVDGGTYNGVLYEGFGGDYDEYLASLKEMNLNYSAQALLIRYQLVYEELAQYYMGSFSDDSFSEDATLGQIKITREEVEKFYKDPTKSRRVLIAQLDENYFTKERALEIRDSIASKASDKEVANYIANFTLSTPVSEVIGKYTYDDFYYEELTNAAFSLEVGETSEVITLKTDVFDGYVIVYRLDASEDFFNSSYSDIATSYSYSEFGLILKETREKIVKELSPTDTLKELDRSKVSMN